MSSLPKAAELLGDSVRLHPPVGLSVSLNPGAPDGLCSLSAWQASEACGLRVRVCSVGPDTTDCSISTWLLTQAIWELLQRNATHQTIQPPSLEEGAREPRQKALQ